jgi:hypothetical protein
MITREKWSVVEDDYIILENAGLIMVNKQNDLHKYKDK